MGHKEVFISYKAEEFNEADWVRSMLENSGISCWMAPSSIPGGASYASEIPAAIRNCKVFVLILSEKCQTSKWVPRELDKAINENKPIMPFMLENCELKDEFNFYLTNVQRYAAYENREAVIQEMIDDIRARLGMVPEQNPDKEEVEPTFAVKNNTKCRTAKKAGNRKNTRKKPKLPLMICASFVAVIVVAILFHHVNTVIIGGERYSKSESGLYFYDLDLSSDDMENIASLKNLAALYFENCTFQDENVGNMFGQELTALTMMNCNLTKEQIESMDFSGLELYRLNLSGNEQLTKLDLIEPLKDSLSILVINDTSVSDISVLSSFSTLTELYADNNSISDISPLADCNKLVVVTLNGNQISDLSAFRSCPKLAELAVNGNKLRTLAGLEQCLVLEAIEAGSNELTSIEGLDNATRLEYVFLNNNQIEDASLLSKSADYIRKLYLRNNLLTDISFLAGFTELTYLSLDHNAIDSLKVLSDSKKLKGISASGNQISSIEGMDALPELIYLNLADNALTVTGDSKTLLLKSVDGAVVDLGGSNLEAINVTYSNKFKLLSLVDCEIADYSFLYSTKGTRLVVEYNALIDFSLLAGTDYYKYIIIGCPLDKQLNIKETLGTYETEFVEKEEFSYDMKEYFPGDMIGNSVYY